jgi:hypothetical protein
MMGLSMAIIKTLAEKEEQDLERKEKDIKK